MSESNGLGKAGKNLRNRVIPMSTGLHKCGCIAVPQASLKKLRRTAGLGDVDTYVCAALLQRTWQLVCSIHEPLKQDPNLKETVPPLSLPGKNDTAGKVQNETTRKGVRMSTFAKTQCARVSYDKADPVLILQTSSPIALPDCGGVDALQIWTAVASCPADRSTFETKHIKCRAS